MILKDYQEKAVKNLEENVLRILANEPDICIFKSPTGSGKTIMMAELINRISTKNLSFIWISLRDLHSQSRHKLEKYYNDTRNVTCSNFEDLEDHIKQNEILFLNWESINKQDNIYIRDNEKNHNLSNIINNTKQKGHKIILIIDESHHTAEGENSLQLIDVISPDVTIEVSATPKLSNNDYVTPVRFVDVEKAGMVKKSIIINQSIDKINYETEDDLIIRSALKQQDTLSSKYQKLNRNVNPLILIQLPPKIKGYDKRIQIEEILKKYDITTENNKLAIDLSNHKINVKDIEKNDSQTKVIIFKQGLSLGWDCPRASILVLFREWKKCDFSIQTMGRIMRMPEHIHYEDDILNDSYVYSNIEKLEIIESVVKDYFKILESKKIKNYEKTLESTTVKRHTEEIMSHQIFKLLYKMINKNEIKLNSKIKDKIMLNGKIKPGKNVLSYSGKTMNVELDEIDLQSRFTKYSIESFSSNPQMLRQILYKLFEKKFHISDYQKIQSIILDDSNNEKFTKAIRQIKNKLKKSTHKIITNQWSVPNSIMYDTDHIRHDFKKSIMKPVYIKKNYSTELNFMNYLDNSNISWWYKNGENDSKYFSILYYAKKEPHLFFVDFIICQKDGTIGLFDTKSDFTLELPETKLKAKALSKYIKKHNLFGGIVTYHDDVWIYNDGIKYNLNFKKWKPLDSIVKNHT